MNNPIPKNKGIAGSELTLVHESDQRPKGTPAPQNISSGDEWFDKALSNALKKRRSKK